ncbi:alpha-(1,3)-fucosyltransferase fut-1-like [Watersipora subatra]|uniref:alpha-(1,3)-fucosyltransferase fut-1-like n=1 Tax=Watersipora subatra TaxID=2589382 RepID=UPI00355BF926
MNGFNVKFHKFYQTCGKYKCIQEMGGTNISGADLVIFNERAVTHYKVPRWKGASLLTAFHSKEPYDHLLLNRKQRERWNGLFNYSVTYAADSDGSLYSFAIEVLKRPNSNHTNFAALHKHREARALWFVSHCSHLWKQHRVTSARAEYVQELSKHIRVDAYTKYEGCLDQLGDLIKNEANKSEPALGEYTFYLSFESTLCTDYISEKFWKVLKENGQTIPVALGGRSIEEYTKVAPPNSFIHVRNFTSPKALAKHLNYVADDDKAFNYYHNWRNRYELNKTKHRIEGGM